VWNNLLIWNNLQYLFYHISRMSIFLGTVTVTSVTGIVVLGIEVPSTISVLFQRFNGQGLRHNPSQRNTATLILYPRSHHRHKLRASSTESSCILKSHGSVAHNLRPMTINTFSRSPVAAHVASADRTYFSHFMGNVQWAQKRQQIRENKPEFHPKFTYVLCQLTNMITDWY
jgi:hypothetical protein